MDYLRLMRAPNLFTAMADVLAGFFIVSGGRTGAGDLPWLLLATSALYAGGCVLNDICDRRIDARERPSRPLPSGRVSSREATTLALLLFAAGLSAAYRAGAPAFAVSLLLLLLIVLYDTAAKSRSLAGPLTMGACRAANLLLGMSTVLPLAPEYLLFPLVSFLYVFSLTRLSRFEVSGSPRKGGTVLAGWGVVLLSLFLMGKSALLAEDSIPFLALFALFTGRGLLRGLLHRTPHMVGRAVGSMVLGIPLIDAVYVSGIQGWAYGIPVALCIIPSLLLSRYFYVT
ncbi:MAG: UbiA-like protein EboC [Alphaproteobacteria bacterium]|uniref:UbiA-like protein EboC n=1 Tax=Candidatus Nitrobium versatile TaxID=2884831 RepID=A0A953M338_9BACT|nr:UbiA-like protein EboC [Candidatus Nitrobium versatile]